MIYAISDIHGRYDKYQELLKTIHFGPDDTLYVLGDVIDRGPDGFKILMDMAGRPNVVALLGNHEAMAMEAIPLIQRVVQPVEDAALTDEEMEAIELWFFNGGEPSLADFFCLDDEQAQTALTYMQNMLLYREVEAGDRRFVLVHGGLENFSPEKPLEDYKADEILWCRPDENRAYYPDKYLIFGHTPVQLLDKRHADAPAVIYRKGNWIDIDCGCVFSEGRLGCLCLDTLEEIYV